VSGTGSAAMECTVVNTVSPADRVLVLVNGYFGRRLAEMARRAGGEVVEVAIPWGQVFTLAEVAAALEAHKPAVVFLVHAETSTGAMQPMEGLGALVREKGALLVLDTVTSLAGAPVFLDRWLVDAAYSGTQKCVGAPPGLAPVMFNDRAMAKILARQTVVGNWYLDMKLIVSYWALPGAGARAYHHTAPVSANFGLYEALRLVEQEGLQDRWARHRANADALYHGIESLGLSMHVAPEARLPSLTTVRIPEDVDGAAVVARLRDRFNIEIAGGLGELAGKVWRIGLMGYNSRQENVTLLLAALADALPNCRKAK